MRWVIASAMGVLAGALAGWLTEQLPIWALLRSLTAFLAAVMLGDMYLGPLVGRLVRLGSSQGQPYVGFGRENLVTLAKLGAVAIVVHIGLGWLAVQHAVWVGHRPILLGVAGGLVGVLSAVWALTILSSGVERRRKSAEGS
jgi:hypothetical protein